MNVAILGASNNPTRFSYVAFQKLLAHGHRIFPVSPKFKAIEDVPVVGSLGDLKEPIDTLTMYVGPERSTELVREILALKPRRVIFNPGSENPPIERALEASGVEVERACTLVLLDSGKF